VRKDAQAKVVIVFGCLNMKNIKNKAAQGKIFLKFALEIDDTYIYKKGLEIYN